ncbi:alpha/beta hydrolase [Nibrella viscosa]|uniref:Alpha/beta hydrolase n=1 Tax=Nibrella viscosa TaxID=1084524 RepID=A0ABP8KS45_9BACT
MKWFRHSLRIFFGILVLLNVILAFHANRFTYFYDNPRKLPARKAEEYTTAEKLTGSLFGMKFIKSVVDGFPQVPHETVRLLTNDGFLLEGWYVPARQPQGTVILCHGHASNKAKILAETQYFHELDYNTLSFDFRAHGNSSGNVCTIGYRETRDLEAAYEYVAGRGEQNIVLWGVSMGAATILKAIPEHNLKPSRIILECPFATMYDAVKGRIRTMHLPESPASELLLLWGGLQRGMWSFGYRPDAYARDLTMPVLLNWGARDPRVLRHETDTIFRNLGSRHKQLVIYENSAHQSFCKNEEAKWKEAISRFLPVAAQPATAPIAVLN